VKRFRISRLAEADLDDIWLYVARDGSTFAFRYGATTRGQPSPA
jgi:plasmid stabilization system protein ParE